MKARMIVTCFVVLLYGVAPAFADNRMDIILEGPWILYQDHAFPNGATKVDVLIAMTPGVTMLHPHQPPSISSGDGFWINPGVYCVGFDQVCAGERQAHSLSPHDYSQLKQPQAPTGWNWFAYNYKNPNITFLIFPMPDSLRNKGVYHMRFAKQFGTGYGADELHSIGVVLHYKNGPQQVSLAQCSTSSSSLNATACTPWGSDSLDNTDTLEIVMKAPDDNNACDLHVRSAYPEMLKLIGDKAANPDMGYIDPAIKVKSGKGVYASETGDDVCYKCDTQDPNYNAANCSKMNGAAPTDLASLFGDVTKTIAQLEDRDILPTEYQKKVFVPQLREQYNELDKTYPRISQLLLLKLLLSLSSDQIHELVEDQSKNAAPRATTVGKAASVSLNVKVLIKIAGDERTEAASVPTKNGGDCRAPVMLVK